MVEHILNLNSIFGSLADPTRRDILRRVARQDLSISEIAKPYNLTFAAISKHLKVLEHASLVIKKRRGKEQIVQLSPVAIEAASQFLRQYQLLCEERFERLDTVLENLKNE